MEFLERHHISALYLYDPAYPSRLKECEDAPILLYVRGKKGLQAKRALSVVGTRKASAYGKELCRNIAIIDHGDIVQNTDMKSLLATLDIETLVLDIREPLTVPPAIEGVEFKLRDETTLEASLPKQKSLNAMFSALDEAGVHVMSMRNKANRLEELFLRMVDKGTTV